jgi:tetratricopeptide (TPR) repeat protein
MIRPSQSSRKSVARLLAGLALLSAAPLLAESQSPPSKEAIQAQDVLGNLVAGDEKCGPGSEYLSKALEFYRRQDYDIALELAAQVQPAQGCDFTFLQASGLRSSIYVFAKKDYDRGIAAAKKGLDLDSRQTTLWFTAGYAQYQVDSYEEALESYRKVLQHNTVVPMPEAMLAKTRYLIADTTDRNAMREGLEPGVLEKRMVDAITAWQDYQDFCAEAQCSEAYLGKATERIDTLRKELRLLQFKTMR